MRIGITGHSNLTTASVPIVTAALRVELDAVDADLVGVSCLARGADQAFARVILDLGAELHVVLPSTDYRDRKVKPDNRAEFEGLLGRAAHVDVLPFDTANRDAYEAANEKVLGSVDALVAVWDGQPPDGKGGTADTVRLARERGLPVQVVWPAGAERSA